MDLLTNTKPDGFPKDSNKSLELTSMKHLAWWLRNQQFTLFTLTVTRGWTIQQIDINNAFLNGKLQEQVFMHQLEGFLDPSKPHHVFHLRKALYELKQAPHAWFDKLKTILFIRVSRIFFDTSLFCSDNHVRMLLIVYIDDILITVYNPLDVH